jgi:diguanylate cyclase (GGDEF)-like protein
VALFNLPVQFRKIRERLSLPSGSVRSILAWPFFCIIALIVGWFLLFARLDHERASIERSALKESDTLAQAYADYLFRNFETIDQIALYVRYAWGLSNKTLKLEDISKQGLFPASELVLISVAGPDGNVITSTIRMTQPVNISDREHFRVHQLRTNDNLFISKPVRGRLSGRSSIQFSRKLTDADGTFAGVVVVSVDPTFFALSFEFSTVGANDVLALVGEDKVVRTSRIGHLPSTTNAPVLVKVPGSDTLEGHTLLQGAEWFSDKRNRFTSWYEVPKYPFIAVAALDETDQLLPYFKNRSAAIQTGIVVSSIAMLMMIIGTVSAFKLARTRHHSEALRKVYRLATEAATDGFYILEPVHGTDGKLIDFEIVDCNERGAELIGDKRSNLIRMRVSTFYSGKSLKHVMRMLRSALKHGVYEDDYQVPEPSPLNATWVHLRLLRSDNNIAMTLRDISEARQHIDELKRQGNQDALTSLYNRHWLRIFLPELIDATRSRNSRMALLYIDIDGFKAVNDTMGHAAGDDLLKLAAHRVRSVIRPKDKAVRLGGDEFLIILEDIRHEDEASHIAERIVELFSEKFKLKQGVQTVGVSVGISLFPKDGDNAKTLLQNADIAMYSAKEAGKGQYRFFNPAFYDRLKARLTIEGKLRDAVELDQFVMYYQPRVDIKTGRVTSLEALVRWHDPDRGFVEPIEFIDIAEQSGLIVSVGSQVINKVCRQLSLWCKHSQNCVPVSINVSPKQINKGGLHAELKAALAKYHLSPDLVEIEVTESSMMADIETISGELESLQRLGVKLLVDDFGTGYSSLSQLQRLETDGLKIDRAFTSELGRSRQGEIFFTAIVTMAHALGMRVVAEGVETAEQAGILKRLKCDEIQGFYISRPIPANDVPEIIGKQIDLAA